MKIDSKAIRELAKILEDAGLSEIEVTEGEQSIRVSKNIPSPHGGGTTFMAAPAPAAAATVAGTQETETTSVTQGNTLANPADHPGAVTSPMVGTVYMKPDPQSPPFVKKGDTVSEGDTLLIIEAMKVMNPIKAPKSGKITQILAENEKPVEFGDVLMIIE